MAIATNLLWALIGLLLTIGGTFLEASIVVPGRDLMHPAIQSHALGITYQFGAGLLIGCVGGRSAATLSQLAYIILGLTPWFPIFANGGGVAYLREPSFGYLLGFVPGAWICGFLAFKALPRLETLAMSCLAGLLSIHVSGITYLLLSRLVGSLSQADLVRSLLRYSLEPLPGQFAVICAVTLLAFALRHVMFY